MTITIRTIRINGYKTKHTTFEDAEKAIRNNEYNPNGEGKFYITETIETTTEINHTVGLSDVSGSFYNKLISKLMNDYNYYLDIQIGCTEKESEKYQDRAEEIYSIIEWCKKIKI